jgi:hypothetical protein
MTRIARIRRHLAPVMLLSLLALVLLLGASFVALGADLTDQNGASAVKDQQDPAGTYAFTLPNGWKAGPSNKQGAQYTDTVNGTQLLITMEPANGRSLGDVMKDSTDLFKHERGYREGYVKNQDLTLGGQPGKGIRYYSDDTDVDQGSTAAVITINNGNLYVLTFRTKIDKEKVTAPSIIEILNSWRFV